MNELSDRPMARLVERNIILTSHSENLTYRVEQLAIALDFISEALTTMDFTEQKAVEFNVSNNRIICEQRVIDPIVQSALHQLCIVKTGAINWLKIKHGSDWKVPTKIKHQIKPMGDLLTETNIEEVIFVSDDRKLTYESIVEILERNLDLMSQIKKNYPAESFYYFNTTVNSCMMDFMIGVLGSAIILLSSKCI
jgi:hypothetical protein